MRPARCVADAFEMLHLIAGGEAEWRARPFVSNSNCFVVPPMKFATEACQTMELCIEGGMPVLLLSAGMAGATTPSTIAGAIVQSVAELGHKWYLIAQRLPGRTDHAIRNRYHRLQSTMIDDNFTALGALAATDLALCVIFLSLPDPRTADSQEEASIHAAQLALGWMNAVTAAALAALVVATFAVTERELRRVD